MGSRELEKGARHRCGWFLFDSKQEREREEREREQKESSSSESESAPHSKF